jgi:HlyD family secretion protein
MALSRKRKIIIGASAAVVLLLIVVISIVAGSKDAPEVTTVRIERRPELRSVVTASGEVRPIRFIKLTSEVAGRIEEIYVKQGDHVKKGQELVRLDPTQLQTQEQAQFAATQAALSDVQNARTQVIGAQNQVLQAQENLAAAEASLATARQQVSVAQTNVDKAKVDLNKAERELKRTTELVESNVASRLEYDTARDTYELAKVALRTAEEQLKQQKIAVEEAIARVNQQKVAVKDAQTGVARAEASLKSSEARANQQQANYRGQVDLRNKTLQRSPLDGVVADLPSRIGEFATANFSSTPLMTIADMSTINVEVNVDETEIADVEVGQPAKIKVDAFGDRDLEAIVTQKYPLAVGKSDTQGGLSNRINVQEAKEFLVVLELRNLPDEVREGLRPGMSATATITTKVKKDVIAVPLQAIVEKTPTPAGSPSPGSASPTPTPVDRPRNQKGVYILEGNKAKFVEVTTGITGESDIEIISGVSEKMEVITGPNRVLRTLKDGTIVKKQARRPGAANSNEAR